MFINVSAPPERLFGRDLAAVVELHALPEIERPREPIPRGAPELRQRRLDRQRLVELHETVEDLLGDGSAVDVADPSGVERLGVMAERSAVHRAETGALPILGPGR
jgi:hypothetical protein